MRHPTLFLSLDCTVEIHMRRTSTVLLLVMVVGIFQTGTLRSQSMASGEGTTALKGRSTLIEVENPKPGEKNELFDLADSDEWFQPVLMSKARSEYRAALLGRLGERGLDQRDLLERQCKLYAAQSGKPSQRESENGRLVLDGRAGKQRPVTTLEWLLFQYQARRYPMIGHPTEFSAYVLRGNGRLHVYMSGADSIGTKLRYEVTKRAILDVKAGMEPIAHLHNHPFMFDRVPGDRLYTTEDSKADIGGALAPSLTDIQALRRMRDDFGLRGAWITNGLDTYEFKAVEFDRLSAWD